MSGSRLHTIQDWVERGQRARYQSAQLAALCQISPSQLNRFYTTFFYRPTQHWLDELRICDSTELLAHGCTVKETAFKLHYADPSHFSHAFKKYYGIPPNQLATALREFTAKYDQHQQPIWIQARKALLSPLAHSRRNQKSP